jgi:hypothetical protein
MSQSHVSSVLHTLGLVEKGKIDAHPCFTRDNLDYLLRTCNGCGAKGSKLPIPQTNYFMDMRPACNPHDVGYDKGVTIEDKQMEDRRMLNNSLRLIHLYSANKFMIWLRTRRALKYYEAVNLLGGPAFWDGKQK